MKAERKCRPMTQTKKEKMTFSIIVAFFLIVSFIAMIPDVLRYKVLTIILYSLKNLILSATVIGFSFFCNKKDRVKGLGMFLSISSVIILWLMNFLSKKMYLNIVMLAIVLCLTYSLFLFLKHNEKNRVLIGITLYYFIVLLNETSNFTFIDDNNKPLILVGIISLIFTVIAICLVVKNQFLKKMELSEKIALPFLVFLFSAGLIFSTYTCLNCSLDTNAPVSKNYTIIDSGYIHGYRTINQFKFYFEINNTKTGVAVSPENYYSYDVGDEYTVYYSNGFFNDPYIFAD